MRPKTASTFIFALLCLPVSGAWAQTAPRSVQPKIAIINLQRAVASTAEGKKASAALEGKFSLAQSDLQAMQKQLQELQNRITNSNGTDLIRLQRQAELLNRQYQRKKDGLTEALDAAQIDVIANIGARMQNIIDRYARENGYVVVLNTTAAGGSPVVYASNQINITDDIVQLFDQKYPVKGDTP
jgi:outer membrane protein